MAHLITTILNILLVLVGMMTIILLLLPRPRIHAWFKRREGFEILHFKTAARLFEHLESVGRDFVHDADTDLFFYFVDAVSVEQVQYFTTSRSLRKRIIVLDGRAWLHYCTYPVDVLLPLARIEKLRLLVSP